LLLLSAIVMLLAGLAHTLGYKVVMPVLAKSNVPANIADAIRCVWLVYSAHLILLSLVIVWLSRLPGTRSLLLFLALFPISDAVFMYRFVGPFLGLYMVATAAILLLFGAWLLPRNQTA
jgi:hypothetical protein